MSELSMVGKIMQALDLAQFARIGCTLTWEECLELLGIILKQIETEHTIESKPEHQ
jgi:hypothetical protein